MTSKAKKSAEKQVIQPMEDFAALLEESFGNRKNIEGTVVKGKVIRVENDLAIIDVGLKSEGRIALKEFASAGQTPEIKIGDEVEVYVERIEDRNGDALLSREKARREESWIQLENNYKQNVRVTGVIFGRVKGGFTVDLSGAVAFLPGSQVDVRPIRDITPLMGQPQPFQILKMDRVRGNIVVSRRAILEESRAEARSELVAGLKEGQILEGTIKNITDYGAFVDLGGVDGLLHVTDISWQRINKPSDVLSLGQQVKVQIIRFNPENQRISLGMKQLESDPWQNINDKYPVGKRVQGRITKIMDFGAFIELEAGVEGLIHVSEMSWTKKNVHPSKIVAIGQQVDVVVLAIEMDNQKRRISLGLKQISENPWTTFQQQHPVGSTVEGEVRNVADFGLFIGLPNDMDGMVHMSDIDWQKPGEQAMNDFKKGDKVTVRVLDIDPEKERISLGIKQLTEDPFAGASETYKKGDIVTVTITSIQDSGLEVSLKEGVVGFIRKADLARERAEQRTDRFAVGEKVDAKVTSIDAKTRKVSLSIKAHEIDEEKQAMADYGSSDSGASLGDILGAAISKAQKDQKEPPKEPVKEATKETKTKKKKTEEK
ncbi:MAG TPA: 30S ribosomal protein S1 [Alphaproteobacteria bacterium]|jgi:small subunit ribosomal protein S1|nr:30S ribosomal protein S1 [Alphaproteobacteria bacterium]